MGNEFAVLFLLSLQKKPFHSLFHPLPLLLLVALDEDLYISMPKGLRIVSGFAFAV
jgi:hypothetical protein